MNYIIIFLILLSQLSCADNEQVNKEQSSMNNKTEIAVFGAGCFWCTEAVFQRVEGVMSVESGYSGGKRPNPTYEQVVTGATGHAEVTRISFNPDVISFDELLEIFFKTHDPTTLNRQGADVGTQYRSVVFYTSEIQKEKAEYWKNKINEAGIYDNPIVTEISELKEFYKAEDYHQNYYEQNKSQPYCSFVITPKVNKLEKLFKDKLK
jgi:peptide-methionine (S)-S-oxide reductase